MLKFIKALCLFGILVCFTDGTEKIFKEGIAWQRLNIPGNEDKYEYQIYKAGPYGGSHYASIPGQNVKYIENIKDGQCTK